MDGRTLEMSARELAIAKRWQVDRSEPLSEHEVELLWRLDGKPLANLSDREMSLIKDARSLGACQTVMIDGRPSDRFWLYVKCMPRTAGIPWKPTG